jgi:hypothetical protein
MSGTTKISVYNYTGEKIKVVVSDTSNVIPEPPVIAGTVEPSNTTATMLTVDGTYDTFAFAGKTYFGRTFEDTLKGQVSTFNPTNFTIAVGVTPDKMVDSSGKAVTLNPTSSNNILSIYLDKYSKTVTDSVNDFIAAQVEAVTGQPPPSVNYLLILLIIIIISVITSLISVAAYRYYMKQH